MKKKVMPLSQVYRYLEPGPVVLVSTSRNNRMNIMTMSWLTMMEFEPPLIGCVISNRNYSFAAIKSTKECVINIPTEKLAKQVVSIGNCSGRNIDKFKTFQLTPLTGTYVYAPLIAECYVNLECKVIDTKIVTKYNFFILEVVKAWISTDEKNPRTLHHMGKGVFMVGGKIIKLPSKMK